MSLHYLLDAYNILHQLPIELKGKLEDQRQRLIDWLEVSCPQGSVKNSITLVFDGKSGMISSHQSSSIRIIFSQDESADEKIKRMVEHASNKKNIVVVTNDKDVKLYTRSLGAQVLSVQEFAGKARKSYKPSAKGKSSVSENQKVSYVKEAEITKELSEIWLKKKIT